MKRMNRISFDKLLLYIISIAVVCLLAFTARKEFSGSDIAFADIGKIAESYKYKIDLEKSSGGNLNRIKYVIDSLQMVKKAAGYDPKVDTQLVYAQSAFDQYYQQSNQEITKKIWDRLNPLMEQYGKEKSSGC